MGEKYRSKLSVNLILTRENNGKKEIMLQLRQNSGYRDGMYDFVCGGHVEKNESYAQAIVREAKEELGITIKEKDLEFLIVIHHFESDYVQILFTTKSYEGIPIIKEPDVCAELAWADIKNLPSNTIPYIENILKDIEYGIQYDDCNFIVLNNYKDNDKIL